jgi:hypothetical protein
MIRENTDKPLITVVGAAASKAAVLPMPCSTAVATACGP